MHRNTRLWNSLRQQLSGWQMAYWWARENSQSWSSLGSLLWLLLPGPWSIFCYSKCSNSSNLSFPLPATRNESGFFFSLVVTYSLCITAKAGMCNGPNAFCKFGWKGANSLSYFISIQVASISSQAGEHITRKSDLATSLQDGLVVR